MASNTKMFTAIAVLQLRDAGKLSLDDPVVKRLPWFRLKNAFSGEPEVTVRQLLTHTGGLPREAGAGYWNGLDFPAHEQIIQNLASQEMVFAPDTKWKYSNLGFTLAGEIVEAVSGERYAEYIERHILRPLGMKSSTVVPTAGMAGLATGFGRRMPDGNREVLPFTDCRDLAPAAGLASNVEDFARFAAFQMGEPLSGANPVLKASTLREMHRVQWVQPDWKSGWGLGFAIRHEGDTNWIGHGGSLAGYRTQTWFDPEHKIGILAMTNANDGAPDLFANEAIRSVVPAIRKAAGAPKPAPTADPSWSRYAGLYRSAWGDVQVVFAGGRLILFDPNDANPSSSAMTLVAAGNDTFRAEATGFSYGAVGEQIRFETGPTGAITRVWTGAMYSDRVQP
jgi:CubicO group peptidase (beta-lactamase class C family)